jgi:hypothetical protein
MAIKRNRLTAVQKRQNGLYMRQLLADGIASGEELDLAAVGQEPSALEITQGGSGTIRQFSSGDPVYEIPIRLIAAERISIADYSLITSFDPQTIELPFLTERRGYYTFAGRQYLAGDILNDYLEGTSVLKQGEVYQGIILAFGCVEVPPNMRSGMVRLQLTFKDGLGRECEANSLLRVLDQGAARNSKRAITDPLSVVDKAVGQTRELPREEPTLSDRTAGR